MRMLLLPLLTLAALVSVGAEAIPDRSYHCEGSALSLDFQVEDLGRTYPRDYPQHTYRVSYRTSRKGGAELLKGVEKTQAYVKNDQATWDYAFATNPLGGRDQPAQSIWVTSNDRDEISAMYSRAPYNRQELACRKQ